MAGRSRFFHDLVEWDARLYAPVEVLPSGRPRRRCKKCRKGFTFFTVDGRFCSPECAEWPEYRWHAVWALREWREDMLSCGCRGRSGRKLAHRTEQEAREAARETGLAEGAEMNVYPCPHKVGRWHTTSQPLSIVEPEERAS